MYNSGPSGRRRFLVRGVAGMDCAGDGGGRGGGTGGFHARCHCLNGIRTRCLAGASLCRRIGGVGGDEHG